MNPQFLDAAIAVGLGLLIGLEREHHELKESTSNDGHQPGVRTFALLALGGWLSAFLGSQWSYLPAAVLLGAAALLVRGAPGGKMLTTEAAALVTVLLGALVPRDPLLAVALAVVTTLLLISKPWVRKIVPQLRRTDFTSTLQLCVALAIILPLLPVEAADPWAALPPRQIGLFVTLILAVSWVGYVLSRLLGSERSAALTGVVGGLASSTAVTASMAQNARTRPELGRSFQLATFLACAMMSIRLLVIAVVASPQLARLALPGVGALGLVMLAGAGGTWLRIRRHRTDDSGSVAISNPVSLLAAVKWGVFLSVVLVASALAYRWFGNQGTLVTAGFAGLADVDALALALSRGGVPVGTAALALVIAAVVNTAVKAGIAFFGGGRRYGIPMLPVFAVAISLSLGVAMVCHSFRPAPAHTVKVSPVAGMATEGKPRSDNF